YSVLNDIEFQESRVNSTLSVINDMPFSVGRGSKQGMDLEKQLAQLSHERNGEEIACWRDTNRLLGDIFESWTGYADERRKKRLMDDGF
ncbi:MAG: hypothetical protein DRQ64_09195, partial [Gammaproteobacteria bacterium]